MLTPHPEVRAADTGILETSYLKSGTRGFSIEPVLLLLSEVVAVTKEEGPPKAGFTDSDDYGKEFFKVVLKSGTSFTLCEDYTTFKNLWVKNHVRQR